MVWQTQRTVIDAYWLFRFSLVFYPHSVLALPIELTTLTSLLVCRSLLVGKFHRGRIL